MLAKEDQERFINHIRELPDQICRAVDGLTDEQLDTVYRDDGWTVRQVVHHLADAHLNAFVRFKLILTEDNPTLKPYDQVLWAELDDTTRLPIEPSLKILRGLHARWAALMDSLTEEHWERKAHHPEIGPVSLADLLYNYSHHGHTHLEQITALKEQKGW